MELSTRAVSGGVSAKRGAILVETLLLLGVLFVPLFLGHLELVKRARERLQEVQAARLDYDGGRAWRD